MSQKLSERHLTFGSCLLSSRLRGLCRGLTSRLLLTRKHLHIVYPNLYDSATHTILVVIRATVDAALDIELIALVHILFYGLRQATPEDEIVPLCTLGHLSAIRECVCAVRCRKRKTCHSHITVNITHIGLTTHITDKDYFIY